VLVSCRVATVPSALRLSVRRPVVWAGRVLLWLALGLILLRGVVAMVEGPGAHPSSSSHVASFPTAQASAFARQYALSYLTYSAAAPGAWAASLAGFSPAGSGAPADMSGWDDSGTQQAIAAESWGVTQDSPTSASVEVAALVSPKGGAEHWVYLQVPVVTSAGGFAVAATPVFVGGPPQAPAPSPPPFNSDEGLSNQLQGMVSAFFAAYGSSNTAELSYFLAPGSAVAPLGGSLRFSSLASLAVGSSTTTTHPGVAAVVWKDPASGASFTQDYSLRLSEQGGRWYVATMGSVGPALLGAAAS
jgi:hypothetical protein